MDELCTELYYQSLDPVNTGALPVNMQSLCNKTNTKRNVDYKIKHKKAAPENVYLNKC
jgi:hypothetical protein